MRRFVFLTGVFIVFFCLLFFSIFLSLKENGGNRNQHIQYFTDPSFDISYDPIKLMTEDKKYSLISSRDNKFYCTGSCTCKEVEGSERRSAAVAIERGIFFLVASTSSIIAIKKATEYFKTECQERFSGVCAKSSVKSNVESCDLDDEEINILNGVDVKEKEFRKYSCKGNCVKSSFKSRLVQKQAIKYGGCEKYELEAVVKLEYTDNAKRKKGLMNRFARHKFSRDHLKAFCKQSSRWRYWVKGIGYGRHSTAFLCSGKPNPSVRCKMIL